MKIHKSHRCTRRCWKVLPRRIIENYYQPKSEMTMATKRRKGREVKRSVLANALKHMITAILPRLHTMFCHYDNYNFRCLCVGLRECLFKGLLGGQQTTALKWVLAEHCIWALLGTIRARLFNTHFRLGNFHKSSPWPFWLWKAKENFPVKTNFATRGLQHRINSEWPGSALGMANRKRLKVSLGKPKDPNVISYIVFSSDMKYIHDRQMTQYKN